MQHLVIPPLILGALLTVGGILLLCFSRQFVSGFPAYWSRTNWARTKPNTRPNTRLRVVMFGVVITALGLLILLSGGLQLF
jgi:uncharacterized iron-regulated membrane protein